MSSHIVDQHYSSYSFLHRLNIFRIASSLNPASEEFRCTLRETPLAGSSTTHDTTAPNMPAAASRTGTTNKSSAQSVPTLAQISSFLRHPACVCFLLYFALCSFDLWPGSQQRMTASPERRLLRQDIDEKLADLEVAGKLMPTFRREMTESLARAVERGGEVDRELGGRLAEVGGAIQALERGVEDRFKRLDGFDSNAVAGVEQRLAVVEKAVAELSSGELEERVEGRVEQRVLTTLSQAIRAALGDFAVRAGLGFYDHGSTTPSSASGTALSRPLNWASASLGAFVRTASDCLNCDDDAML